MDLTRQQDLINIPRLESLRVLVIGAGGIGSFTTHALAKMGVKHIQVWDKDSLESHNIPNQNYALDQEGQLKVEALRLNVLRDTGCLIETHNEFFEGTEEDVVFQPDIIVVGVDSMEMRTRIFNTLSQTLRNRNVYLVDGRMSSKAVQLHTCNFSNETSLARYRDSLYPDAESLQEPCTARAIIYVSSAITLLICRVIHDIVDNNPVWDMFYGTLPVMKFSRSDYDVRLEVQDGHSES